MRAKRRTAPASSERRRFLKGTLAFAGACVLPGAWTPAAAALPDATVRLLETSHFVYVSPLLRDGSESHCHGEVWYAWDAGSVLVLTARTTWKARAHARGLDRARVWVGDHGRWKGWFSNNEDFRRAPRFDAHVREERDQAAFERLMESYAVRYPEEFPDWEARMRAGFASGARALLRYAPA